MLVHALESGAVAVSDRQCLSALIVDDDPVYCTLLERFLAQNPEYDIVVHACDSAAKALVQCRSREFDLLLVDYHLPDMSGTAFINELHLRVPDTPPPAIILTSEAGASAPSDAIQANAADFLPKRIVNPVSLTRSVHNAVAKHALKVAIDNHTIALENANRELTTKNREIGDFYQKVSHEVKTPLAAAREFIAIVRDGLVGELNDEQVELLEHAIGSCDQIANHFNDLVEITRLDSGKIRLDQELVPIERLIVRAVASCAAAARSCDVTIETRVPADIGALYCDGDRIIQVVSNLLGNAIRFSSPGSQVGVVVNGREDGVDIVVSDQGSGIAEENLQRIFDRLYQVEDAAHQHLGCGLGLGLSIARELVTLHGGEIHVESEVGKGSRFSVYLPAASPD